ncbi:MAG: hypothetical protein ACFFBY_10805, partial [Promethearchaeota archaeon]
MFSILTLLFITWVIFLIILAIRNQKVVIFWENISNTDVSSDYMIILPLLRYILEPIAQLSFTLEMEFTWMFLFFISYPILRILYLVLRKKGRFQSQKYKLLAIPLTDILTFSFKILTTAIFIIGVIMLFGYLIQGYFFVSRYFM